MSNIQVKELFLTKYCDALTNLPCLFQSWTLILSLDEAGNSTIIYKLKFKNNVNTANNIEENVESVNCVKGIKFTLMDIKDREKVNRLWTECCNGTEDRTDYLKSNSVLQWTISESQDFCVISYFHTPSIKRTKRIWSDLKCMAEV